MNFISDIVARIPELLAPPGAEPIDKRIRSGFDLVPGELDVWHNIRGRCFALLAQLCEGLGYESLVRVRCELKARQSELRPEVYTALLDKLTLLQDGALFGNKVANLIALEKLFPGRVPKFEAIASDFIARQLVTDAQFMNAWTRFSQIHEGTCITEECRQLLDQMGSRVQELCGTALSLSGSQAAFVRWAADNDHLLMVRSTGRHEDSDRVMLSGANKTVVGVRPDLQSVRESIGVTLASYFGLSVDQRAMHGCDVSSSFFVPCLLQRMVGELRTGDPISVSGVMFTQEPLGPTPGVAVISASYGQGDGVVNGTVTCDRYLLTPDGEVHSSVRAKERRVGPEGLVSNPKELRRVACLSDCEFEQLHDIRAKLHAFYGTAMDVEFVVEDSYVLIVQARPVVGKKRSEPSYLESPQGAQVLMGETLASGSSAVVQGICKANAIFAGNVGEALELFLRLKDKSGIRAVLVEQGGENVTHLISTFQSLCIPVLAVSGARKLESAAQLTLCPQQGVVLVDAQPIVRSGYQSHPVPAALTLQRPAVPSQIEESLRALRVEAASLDSTSKLVEDLKSSDVTIIRRAVACLLYRLQVFIQGPLRNASSQLQERVTVLSAQVLQLGVQTAEFAAAGRRMEQLLTAKLLKARMLSGPESALLVDGEGFDSLAGEVRLHVRARKELAGVGASEPAIELFKVTEVILNPTVRAEWVQLLKVSSPGEIQALMDLTYWLAKRRLLDVYFNSVFPELLKSQPRSRLGSAMLRAVGRDAALLEKCHAVMVDLDSTLGQVAAFGKRDGVAFQKCLGILSERVFGPLTLFTDVTFAKAGTIGRLVLLTLHQRTLDLNDAALKALVDSPEMQSIDLSERRRRFISLFDPLFEQQFRLAAWLDEASAASLAKWGNLTSPMTVDKFLDLVRELRAKIPAEDPSDTFVADPACAIGQSRLGTASVAVNMTLKLVDLWSLSHQNSLALLSVLRKQTSPVVEQLLGSDFGPLVRVLLDLPVPDRASEAKAALLVTDFEHPFVRMQLNVPLFHHSASIDLSIHTKTKQATLRVTVYGWNEQQRWTQAFILAWVATQVVEGLSFARNGEPQLDVAPNVHAFTWAFAADASEVLPERIKHVLTRIIFLCYPIDLDRRFVSPGTGTPLGEQTVIDLSLELVEICGRSMRAVELFRRLPDGFLQTLFEDLESILLTAQANDSHGLLLTFVDEEVLQFLWQEKKVLSNLDLVRLLAHLLSHDSVHAAAVEAIRRSLSPQVCIALLQESVEDHASRVFFRCTLPHFAMIYPEVYPPFKMASIAHFSDAMTMDGTLCYDYAVVCTHMSFWSSGEQERFLISLARYPKQEFGRIAHYLSSPEHWNVLKEASLVNGTVDTLLAGLLEQGAAYSGAFDARILAPALRQQARESALAEIPCLVRDCDAYTILKCMVAAKNRLDILRRLEPLVAKPAIRTTEWFLVNALPLLCQVDPQWRRRYVDELFGLFRSAELFPNALPAAVYSLVSDVLPDLAPASRQQLYVEAASDQRDTRSRKPGPLGLAFVRVLLNCRSPAIQGEMLQFLKAQQRHELVMWGAWRHFVCHMEADRRLARESGLRLLRSELAPSAIESQWNKVSGWDWDVPCEMLMTPEYQKPVLDLLCYGDFGYLASVIDHVQGCGRGGRDKELVLLRALGALDDSRLSRALESLSSRNIMLIILALDGYFRDAELWDRYLSVLRPLPRAFPDLPLRLREMNQHGKVVGKDLNW